MNPKVTVAIAMYNAEAFIERCLKSVFSQTFKDFEVLIVDDGSTDRSVEKVLFFNHPAVRIVPNEENRGVSFTRNRYLREAKGDYIAIIDSDDEWTPDKLQRQVEFMELNKHIAVSGGYAERIGREIRAWQYPRSYDDIKVRLLFGSSIVNSTCMIRRSFQTSHKIFYREHLKQAEDHDFFCQTAPLAEIVNLPYVFARYHEHEMQFTSRAKYEQVLSSQQVSADYLREVLKLDLDKIESNIMTRIFEYDLTFDHIELENLSRLLNRILEANETEKYFNSEILLNALCNKWYEACFHSEVRGMRKTAVLNKLKPSGASFSFIQQFRMLVKSFIG